MTSGRIAAIITCRDLGRTLPDALDSVEGQTRPASEILVVDDGSVDVYTRQLLARIERDGTCLAQAGGRGVGAARNLGARLSAAEYLVWLDADDALEPGYFAAAAARLDADPDLAFVTSALRAFGRASYTWKPSAPTFVDAISTGGVPHASTMIRRRLWEDVGGFDEELPSYELLDFWATALEQGFHGVVLDEPFLNYRIRADSGYRRSIRPEVFRARMAHFYAKHRPAVERHGLDLIVAKDAFLLEQRRYRESLESRAASLESERAAIQRELAGIGRQLAARGMGRVEMGDLRRTRPLSAHWGRDRGTPIDRYYIEAFLEAHRADIRGRVLEIEEPLYASRFGGAAVERVDVLDRNAANDRADVIADLRKADAIASDTYDCIVLTQTVHLVDDVEAVLGECRRILRPGGVLLITAPSVIRVDDRAERDGDFWRFTEASARRLCAGAFPLDRFEVDTRGNVMTCAAFLYGLSVEELRREELDCQDPSFPLVVTVRAVKPDARTAPRHSALSRPTRAPRTGVAAILAYHRIAARSPDTHRLCTPPDVFRAHMAMLRDGFTPMGLPELVQGAASGCIPERAVVVTLDDGYLDALTDASPILADLAIPATFFLNSDRIDEEHERDWDVLEGMLLSALDLPSVLSLEHQGAKLEERTLTRVDRARALESIHRFMWPLDGAARAAVVNDIVAWSGRSWNVRRTHRVLTSVEIRELAARPGQTVGAHTTHHLALTTQPAATKRREVVDDKDALERALGREVHFFSYPYGEFDADLVRIVDAAGYRAAVTVQEGVVRAGSNRLLLPRLEPGPAGPLELRARLDPLLRVP